MENITSPKYLIFLPNRFNITEQVNVGCFCAKIRRNIIEELNDKGIIVKFRSNIKEFTDIKDSYLTYTFNNEFFPKLNVLYIKLIGGEYYSDDTYTKMRTEKERNILFLLAAKLGVREIKYKIKEVIYTMKKINVNLNIKKSKTEFKYSKTRNETEGESGQETYINRGAPIYSLSDSIAEVEENIRLRLSALHSNSFSYDFYLKNPKLRTFVYKRFNFKMNSVEYTSDLEYDLDISFGVRETLLGYGIGVDFNEHNITCEQVTYNLDFYNDKELRLKLSEALHFEYDPFAVIREVYESEENKNIAIYHITEYVRKYAKSRTLVYYKKREPKNILNDNYHDRLNHWIKENTVSKFEEECHKFTSSFQIRTWFKEALIYGDEEVEEVDNEDEGAGNYGILKLKREINQESKMLLLRTDNYAIASNRCNNVTSQYPLQYTCNLNKRDEKKAEEESYIETYKETPINRRRELTPANTRENSPVTMRLSTNQLLRRRRSTSESNDTFNTFNTLSPVNKK